MKIMMFSLLYFVVFVPAVVFSALTPYITRKTESFGISIPDEVYTSPELKNLRDSFRNKTLLTGTILAGASFIFSLVSTSQSLPIILLAASVFTFLMLTFLFYLSGHNKMKLIKSRSNWTVNKPQAVVIDTEFRKKKVTLSSTWFLLHVVVIAGTFLFGYLMFDRMPAKIPYHMNLYGEIDKYMDKSYKVLFLMPVIQLFLLIIFVFTNWIMSQAKQQIDASNPEKSIEQNRKFRYTWSVFTVSMSFVLLATLGLMQLMFFTNIINPMAVIIIVATVVTFISLGATILSTVTGQGGTRLKVSPGSHGKEINRDDDRYWKLGQFYYNPDDPAVFVEKRFGVGWTNNFARPISWAMVVGIAVLLPAAAVYVTYVLTK